MFSWISEFVFKLSVKSVLYKPQESILNNCDPCLSPRTVQAVYFVYSHCNPAYGKIFCLGETRKFTLLHSALLCEIKLSWITVALFFHSWVGRHVLTFQLRANGIAQKNQGIFLYFLLILIFFFLFRSRANLPPVMSKPEDYISKFLCP